MSKQDQDQLIAYYKEVEKHQKLGVLLDVVASGLSAPTNSGLCIAGAALSPVASYEIGQYFKEKGTEGSSAHLLAHTVLGAAVAAAGGNDALTAGLVTGGTEAAAPALSNFLYGKKASDLTAEEKSTISAITGLVATGVGGAASGDIVTAVQSGQGAQNAVENNYLSELDVKNLVKDLDHAKSESEKDKIYRRYAELSKEKSELAAVACADVSSQACQQAIFDIKSGFAFSQDQNEVNEYLSSLLPIQEWDGLIEISKQPDEAYKNNKDVRFVEYENLKDLSKYLDADTSKQITQYLGTKDYEHTNQPFLDKPWGSMYVGPSVQMVGGGLTAVGGAVIGGTLCETGLGCLVAGYLLGSGVDDMGSGFSNWGKEPVQQNSTLREQLLQSLGMSEGAAAWTSLGLDLTTGLGAAKIVLKPNAIPELSGKYPSEISTKDMTIENNFYRDDYQQYDLYREPNAVHWSTGEPLKGGNWAWAKLDQRSLPPGTYRPDSLHSYTVLKEFRTQEEVIAPAFGQPGGGIQIRAIIPEVPNGYASIEQLKKYEYLGDKK